MKLVSILFLVGGLSITSFAQKFDYLHVRDSTAVFTCTKMDSATIETSFRRLSAIDSNTIDTNLNIYLLDLANVYWMYAALKKDQKWDQESLAILQRLVQIEPESWSAWKSLAIQQAAMDNCTEAWQTWAKYRKLASKEIIEAEDRTTNTIYIKCR